MTCTFCPPVEEVSVIWSATSLAWIREADTRYTRVCNRDSKLSSQSQEVFKGLYYNYE